MERPPSQEKAETAAPLGTRAAFRSPGAQRSPRPPCNQPWAPSSQQQGLGIPRPVTDSPAPAWEKGHSGESIPRGVGGPRWTTRHARQARSSALSSLLGPPLPQPLALKGACLPLSQLQGKKSYYKCDKNNAGIPRHLGNGPALPCPTAILTQAGGRRHTSLHGALTTTSPYKHTTRGPRSWPGTPLSSPSTTSCSQSQTRSLPSETI